MSPTFDPSSAFDTDLPGTRVRRAAWDDVEAILAFWRLARPGERHHDRALIEHLVGNGWFLVVESAVDGLIGAVHIRIQGRIGRVSMLRLTPHHDHRHRLATHLLGVADALCAVFGCTPFEELETHAAA